MKTAGIIAEYNPFHNGHLYHIEETKKAGYDCIVAVMSSNVVQRSEVASFSKHTRAKAAVKSGVNLVIELPCVYALASAEKFAEAGVYLLNALGVVDAVSFGSESGDLKSLSECADACLCEKVSKKTSELLESGISYPKAREKAVETIYGKNISKLLKTPNNILGVEYLKSLKNTSLAPFTIKRKGALHDSKDFSENIASASLLRETVGEDIENLKNFFPKEAFEIFKEEFQKGHTASMDKLNEAVLYKLRSMSVNDFKKLPDVSEGLENRLFEASKLATSVEDFLSRVKTKRYTLSRIKRIVMYALLGIDKSLSETTPQYIRVLAFDEKGRALLKKAKEKSTLPVYHSFAKLQDDFPVFAQKEALASDLFRYACKVAPKGNMDFQSSKLISKGSLNMISIAIDGPSGAGKSTIAKAVSKKLGFIYVDTGALYRSIGLYVLNCGKDTANREEVKALLHEIDVKIRYVDGTQHVYLNEEDVSDAIRKPPVSMAASNVSAHPEVRAFLLDLQRKFAEENNVIMDGRDIGTVVLPNADIKIFLTATAEERANRRYKELIEKGENVEYDKILEEIKQRDYNDSHRAVAPLKQADDAVLADTTGCELEEAIEKLLSIIENKMK